VKIDPDSAAALAGLHVGYVINFVDGKRAKSVRDFAAALVNRPPESKIRIGYMFHSNLFGWVPGAEKVLTLPD
jgi:S1-C subfamily serine protease